ncbi:MAG TPA: hypothetical protein ENO18_01885 [Caldithrix sp.]|nr:hypothetical protein [Caldithrix sp.]
MQFKFAIFSILILVSSLLAGNIFSECNAIPQNDQVSITWITASESNIASFQILRSNDSEVYIELKKVNPKGPGSSYEYIDESVMFKSANVVFYKVRAMNRQNEIIEESAMFVRTQVSDIKETWGAIKALFK